LAGIKVKCIQLFITLSFLFIIDSCSNSDLINRFPKQLTTYEIKKLSDILEVTLNTMVNKINPTYEKKTYSKLPENMKVELQNQLIKDGYHVRADSSYLLGIKDAVSYLRKAC
jgi:hypothetical protein